MSNSIILFVHDSLTKKEPKNNSSGLSGNSEANAKFVLENLIRNVGTTA